MIENIIVYEHREDTNIHIVDILDNFKSVIWHTSYSSTGDFEIYTYYTPLLKVGRFIRIAGKDEVGIIESVVRTTTNEEGDMLIVTGRMATSILDRRIIYKNSRFLGLSWVEPVKISGNVQECIINLINTCIPNDSTHPRRMGLFYGCEIKSSNNENIIDDEGNEVEIEILFESLSTYIETLLQKHKIGAKMVLHEIERGVYKLKYVLYVGEEKDNIFAREFDNLLQSEHAQSELNYKNVAIIKGAEYDSNGDEIPERHQAIVNDTDAGFARKEILIDGSDISGTYTNENDEEVVYSDSEYKKLLRHRGLNQLSFMFKTNNLTGSINLNIVELEKDFSLGDVVIISDYDLYSRARINDITEVQDENGYNIEVQYGA